MADQSDNTIVIRDLEDLNAAELTEATRGIDPSDLALVLRLLGDSHRDKVLNHLPKTVSRGITNHKNFSGPVRIGDVEKAQDLVFAAIRRMFEPRIETKRNLVPIQRERTMSNEINTRPKFHIDVHYAEDGTQQMIPKYLELMGITLEEFAESSGYDINELQNLIDNGPHPDMTVEYEAGIMAAMEIAPVIRFKDVRDDEEEDWPEPYPFTKVSK